MTPQRQFLFELASSLRGPRRARQRLLLEVEQHLEDAVRAETLPGCDPGTVESAAVARLGPAETIAASWNDGQSELRGARRRGYAALALLVALAGALGLAQYASGKARPRPAPGCQAVEPQAGAPCAASPARLPH
ncbi:MAG TPA: hypothetical protein VGJ27_03740 [Gaiellaceae bacterium]|jgi:hypothetical protein